MRILQLQHISILSALISVVSTDSAVAVILDSAVLGDLSEERQLAGIALGKSGHTLHSPANFEVGHCFLGRPFPVLGQHSNLFTLGKYASCVMDFCVCVFFFH